MSSSTKIRRADDNERRCNRCKEIELEDPIENMGAQMVREVASKTSDVGGRWDNYGNRSWQAIVREGMKNFCRCKSNGSETRN